MNVPNGKALLDDTDLRLLEALRADPRLPVSELARQAGLSPPTARARVRRLERLGVIRGYRLDLDPVALGRPVAAYVRVRPGPGQLTKIAELAQQLPEVVECHRITGEDCFLIKLHVAEVGALEEVLDRFLMYGQTTSSVVQSSPVPPRSLPIPKRSD